MGAEVPPQVATEVLLKEGRLWSFQRRAGLWIRIFYAPVMAKAKAQIGLSMANRLGR